MNLVKSECGKKRPRCTVCRGRQLLQTSKLHGLQMSSTTVCRDNRMGFHGQQPSVGCSGVKYATRTLEPWRLALSRFSVWKSVVRVWAWKLPGQRCLSDCAVQSSVTFDEGGIMVWGWFSGVGLGHIKVHNDMDERIWCGRIWLACTVLTSSPQSTLQRLQAQPSHQCLSTQTLSWNGQKFP